MRQRTSPIRIVIYLLIVLVPILLLLLLGRDFVQNQILIPIEYDLWLAGLALQAIPQQILWGLLCVIVLIIGFSSLFTRKKSGHPERYEDLTLSRSARVAFWSLQIKMRARGNYSRLRFADFFSKLILDILTYTGQVSEAQYEEALKTGVLDVPPEVMSFLKTRLTPVYELRSPPLFARIKASFRRLFTRQPDQVAAPAKHANPKAALDKELEDAVKYLEHELEVNND